MPERNKPRTVDQALIVESIHLIAAGNADEAQPLLQTAEEIRKAAQKNVTRDGER